MFERTGKTAAVAEFRADGWPICPCCNNDELAAITPSMELPEPNDVNLCHDCGPVRVVEGISVKDVEPETPKDEGQQEIL